MPAAFEKCVRENGKVRTISLGKNKYQHICIKNGKKYYGHIKTKKEAK